MPFIAIDEQRLHYLDQGTGPVLLLGHSFLWDSRMWSPQIERWSQRHRVIAVDAWGHGQSDSSPRELTLNGLADHHAAVLTSLGISSCVVVGLSMGGMWGLRFAMRHPQLTAGLVVLDAAANAEPAAPRAQYMALLDLVAQAGALPAAVREQVVPGFFAPRTLRERPELVQAFDDDLAALPAEQIPGLVAVGRAVFGRDDIMADLPQITVPTLVGVGADDVYRPVAESQAMAAAIPNADLQVWPDAGHIANLDQSQLVSDAVELFMHQRVTSQSVP